MVIAYFYGMFSLRSRNRGLIESLRYHNLHPSHTQYCNLCDDDDDVVIALRYCSLELNGDALGT
ncbi:MAG TPA: hypothetical protein VFZ55_01110 [Nitrososphaera sp.]